jgi:peroxiredoxin
VAHAYGVTSTPSALIVSSDGSIASPLVSGIDEIRSLMSHALHKISSSNGHAWGLSAGSNENGVPKRNGHPPNGREGIMPLQLGDLAPNFKLPDLDGRPVSLDSLRGHKTLILFWNPDCGFCQRMLVDLSGWEVEAKSRSPRLLVLSSGSVEVNKDMELLAPVVIDEDFRLGRAFGASGTPSAVLVDEEGRIASSLFVGAPDILAYLGQVQTQQPVLSASR